MGIGPGPGPVAQFQVNQIIQVSGVRNPSTLSREDLEYTLYGAGYNTSDLTSLIAIDSGFHEIGNNLLYEISNIDICSTYGNKFTDIFDKPVLITKIGKSAFKHTFCTSNLDFSGWDQLTTIDDEAFSNDIGPGITENSDGFQLKVNSFGLVFLNALKNPGTNFPDFSGIINVESVGVSKQRYDYRLGSINFSNTPSLQSIGQQAFCYGGISGPLDFSGLNSLQEIGKGAFLLNSLFYNGYYNPITARFEADTSFSNINHNINEINFNNCPSLQTIGDSAFVSSGLGKGLINFENLPSLTDICNFAFASNVFLEISGGSLVTQFLNTISFKNCPKLKTIGPSAFYQAGIIGELDFSGLTALTTIDNSAFAFNNLNGPVIFGNNISLETIGAGAFQQAGISGGLDFSGLTALTTISNEAFQVNTNITQFNFFDNSGCTLGINVYPDFSGLLSACSNPDLSLEWINTGFTITNSAEHIWKLP